MHMPFGAGDECRIFEHYRTAQMCEQDQRDNLRKLPSQVRETPQGNFHLKDRFLLSVGPSSHNRCWAHSLLVEIARETQKGNTAMQTKEIQQIEWRQFFNDFSRKHQGSPVGIEVLGSELGAQSAGNGLPLEGITAEWNEVSGNKIMIMIGANADEHVTHSINQPTQVSLEQTDEDADVALAIKAIDGSTALLRFQPSILPETV